ncbi:peptidase family M1-domain-containing protein [Entophlyctis helioformis]|nr:peptidase family M1-domain-containing protein [Entophlyctis helioformis]
MASSKAAPSSKPLSDETTTTTTTSPTPRPRSRLARLSVALVAALAAASALALALGLSPASLLAPSSPRSRDRRRRHRPSPASLSSSPAPPPYDPAASDWSDVRLPPWVSPNHYSLDVTTWLSNFSFAGHIATDFNIAQPSSFLVVHQLDLSIQHVAISTPQPPPRPRAPPLSTGLEGFYRSHYVDKKTGKDRYIATTHFEPVYARRAFPCFDEPDKKAVFRVSVTAEPAFHALSNMPVSSITSLANGMRKFSFEPTVRMASYLVAFIVSDFEYVESKTKNGIVVRVFTPPKSTYLGRYALKAAVAILDYYQSAFAIDFPLPKCDLIAIPDFSAGAMENWGLITFRDTALLYDPAKGTATEKQRVGTVVAHELAHQWFGNLVTMKWWNDLWLNEGFAQFVEYKGTRAAEPNWRMDEQFLFADLIRAMNADESYFTHQIAIPVKNPSEIQDIFDDISYGKGSSILRMLEGYLGAKAGSAYFFQRLSSYLSGHAYSNAETNELWAALEGPSTERFFFSGLVDPLAQVNPDDIPPIIRSPDPANQTWAVPFTYALYSNATARTGVFRVQHDARTLHYLLDWLKKDLRVLPAIERAGLLSDVFALTFSGRLKDVTICLEFSKLLEKEDDPIVWKTALLDLGTFKKAFAHHPSYGLVIQFQQRLLDRIVKTIGWTETTKDKSAHHIRGIARAAILQEAVRTGHAKTVKTALRYFKLLRSGRRSEVDVSQDVLGAIYMAGVMHGGDDHYDWVLDQYMHTTFAPEQQQYLFALASSPASYLQMRTLNLTLTGEVRKQDATRLIEDVSSITPVGHLTSWIFLMDNWDQITGLWKGGDFSKFNGLLKDILGKFTNAYLISEAQRLFVDRKDPKFFVPPGAMVSVLKGLETSKQLLAWQSLIRKDAAAWLRKELGLRNALDTSVSDETETETQDEDQLAIAA